MRYLIFLFLLSCGTSETTLQLMPNDQSILSNLVSQTQEECSTFVEDPTSLRMFVTGCIEFLEGSEQPITIRELQDILLAFSESRFYTSELKILSPIMQFLVRLDNYHQDTVLSSKQISVVKEALKIIQNHCSRMPVST